MMKRRQPFACLKEPGETENEDRRTDDVLGATTHVPAIHVVVPHMASQAFGSSCAKLKRLGL
jgi:hypothetical protein